MSIYHVYTIVLQYYSHCVIVVVNVWHVEDGMLIYQPRNVVLIALKRNGLCGSI